MARSQLRQRAFRQVCKVRRRPAKAYGRLAQSLPALSHTAPLARLTVELGEVIISLGAPAACTGDVLFVDRLLDSPSACKELDTLTERRNEA